MPNYILPAKIFESNLPKLLADLARLDQNEDDLVLDFSHVEYWIPPAIVMMCSMVNRWKERERGVHFDGVDGCKACGYLQRMDFFDRVGFPLPENFTRRDRGTSFVEIEQVLPGIARLRDPLARKLAECLAGTTESMDDVLRLSEFSLGEVIGNCQQHAEKPGYVTAQYVQKMDWARMGIADYGIGIRESFRKAGSPHYREGMTHSEALELAMRPWVSSKKHIKTGPYGESPNRGIGLKIVRHLIGNSGGELFLASGDAWRHYFGNNPARTGQLADGLSIPGTLVSIRFDRGRIADFLELLTEAQNSVNLTPETEDAKFFS